jgi:hypothetical protein
MEAENEFERAGQQPEPGFFKEMWQFLRNNKKWWLLPLLVMLLGLALLAFLSGGPAAPFIYTLF